jgi:hypothetical protein
MLAKKTPQPCEHGTKRSGSMGIKLDLFLSGTMLQRRHQLVHHIASNAPSKNMSKNGH